MTKTVDLQLLNARLRDAEQIVQNAKYIEKLNMEGRSGDDVLKEAKDFLGLGEDGIVAAESIDIIKNFNLQSKAFLELVNFRKKAEVAGLDLSEVEKKYLDDIELRLAETISKRYDIEVDELYMEEE